MPLGYICELLLLVIKCYLYQEENKSYIDLVLHPTQEYLLKTTIMNYQSQWEPYWQDIEKNAEKNCNHNVILEMIGFLLCIFFHWFPELSTKISASRDISSPYTDNIMGIKFRRESNCLFPQILFGGNQEQREFFILGTTKQVKTLYIFTIYFNFLFSFLPRALVVY